MQECASFIITTKDRKEQLSYLLESISKCRGCFETVIVDASKEKSVLGFKNVKYLHFPGISASKGRNIAVENSVYEYLVFVDDDCTVSEDHVERVLSTFASQNPDVIIGNSVSGNKDSKRAIREHKTPKFLANRSDAVPYVTGNNWSAKKQVFVSIGGFDPNFGPGAKYKASEDLDILYRILEHKYRVLVNPSIKVNHFGNEYMDFNYAFGLGGFLGKHKYDIRLYLIFLLGFAKWILLFITNPRRYYEKITGVISGFIA
jgi:GT2 family glycosyltransferase